MRIEKLNENKIRIFLNLEDLNEKNIDLHTFMSNSLETQDLFLDMLEKAEAELGFKTKNYKLIIEALASSEGNFILTVTRLTPQETSNNKKIKKNTVTARRKTIMPNKILSINNFNNFDNFCEFCTYLNNINFPLAKLKSASLVFHNNNYYLILNNLKLSIKDLKSFYSAITEFSSCVKDAVLFESKLKEYGKVIFKRDAICECLKYFY